MPHRFLTALPVFNEESHIAAVLNQVQQYSCEVLVVDDGSSDGTPQRLAELPGIRVLTHPTNLGYGAALRSAFEYAAAEKFDALITIDCDGQHEPKLIPQLAERLFEGTAEWPIDIVSGSRYLEPFDGSTPPPEERRRINAAITKRLNDELGLNLTDAFCGFKAYRTESLKRLEITEDGYAMPLQVWVQAATLGFRIVEFAVPLIYLEEERSFGGSLDDARRRMAYYQSVLDHELAKITKE